MNITLPDGSIKELPKGSTGLDLAASIGPGLAKAALAVVVNGDQKDLSDSINEDAEVSIITINSDEGLEIMRHTLTAQVLARAVQNLYPGTKLAIGPTINDGVGVTNIPPIKKDLQIALRSTKSGAGEQFQLKVRKPNVYIVPAMCFELRVGT